MVVAHGPDGGFIRWAERGAGVLMLVAALYFFYQAAVYAGWLTP